MTRPVYQLDTESVDYEKLGDMTFRFRGSPQLIALFKNPKTVVQGRTRGFAVEWFRIIPGGTSVGLQWSGFASSREHLWTENFSTK
jgi:hypothetical protein